MVPNNETMKNVYTNMCQNGSFSELWLISELLRTTACLAYLLLFPVVYKCPVSSHAKAVMT
jgi:hypothetical protein